MSKLKLKQCKCSKTFNPKESGTTEILCATCNDKLKKKDTLRKLNNRNDKSISSDLTRLEGIDL